MLADKERWNHRHIDRPTSTNVAHIVESFSTYATIGKALDIAAGAGRNTHYLAEKGFFVDAVDYSDVALSHIKDIATINKVEADLDTYLFKVDSYDLIVNCNYLDRRHFPLIKEALKEGGILIFETFIVSNGEGYHQPSNLDFVLRENELLHAFLGLHILYYEEKDEVNLQGEKVKIASLVARKR
ncbi:MAG: methyltransferase domain-containing protein [Helicobacteraceae bacterium]|jgi:tellurite methyltransferase|nr:methyltransferase domain-containing protein [Helicobacteraceae bacterium]